MALIRKKIGESIYLPEHDMRITVVGIVDNRVKLEISKPSPEIPARDDIHPKLSSGPDDARDESGLMH